MAIVHESTTTVQFDAALLAAAARATATYPAERRRIERGVAIVLEQGVQVLRDGSALITSQRDPHATYHVNGACMCPDAVRGATAGRCKHRWAKSLYNAMHALTTRDATNERYWATYTGPDDQAIQGIAEFIRTKQCWLFTAEDGTEYFYAAIQALSLGGHIATAEAQWQAEGSLVERVCRHNGMGVR
jgi:hypothetical protein